MMLNHTLVLMTALIPTTGHKDLIDFAKNLPDAQVQVLINGLTYEAYHSFYRWEDLHNLYASAHNVRITHEVDDNAPQNPEDMPGEDFWQWWRDMVNRKFPHITNWKYVVASEPYGEDVARVLGAQFIPYDIARELNHTKGTEVRSNMWKHWDQVIAPTRQRFQTKAVLFGQESVGKTTISKLVAEKLEAVWLPEWARPYLETVGDELNDTKMENIAAGQYALMQQHFTAAETPAIVLDTDLYSTIGYYLIGNYEIPKNLFQFAHQTKSEVYYILPDDIPFVVDPLRYGGNIRESTTEFWISLCEKNRLNYEVIPSGTVEEKVDFIAQDIRNRFINKVAEIKDFKRK